MRNSKIDEHVFLTGRPPMGEFFSVVQSWTHAEQAPAIKDLADEWRKANDHLKVLEENEAGWADDPPVSEPPETVAHLLEQLLADPHYQRSFDVVPVQVGIVELDRLVVYQKHVNMAFVENVKERLGTQPSEEDVFKTCLPLDPPDTEFTQMHISRNAYVFTSPSREVRFLDSTLLDVDQVTGYTTGGRVQTVLGLAIGFGSNFLNLIHAQGRLILNNGTHRACALRALGVTHVPAVIQQITRTEELETVAPSAVRDNPEPYLEGPRPPVLKDYFNPALHKVLPVPRRNRQLKITYHVDLMDVPAV